MLFAEDDVLVKIAAELVAAAHVADGHEHGIDHPGQLGARERLAEHAGAAQSIQQHGLPRDAWPRGQLLGALA